MAVYIKPERVRYGYYYVTILSCLLIFISLLIFFKFGFEGALVLSLLIMVAVITPLLINRFRFYLFIWLFISPAFDNFREILIAGANPIVLIVTGLSLPFAIMLVIRNLKHVIYKFPFLAYLAIFNVVLFLNFIRPNADSGVLLECLKIFFEIFIIFCGYHEIQTGHAKRLFNGINLFIITNSLIAFGQRLTGFGMITVEGLPRVGGLVGHPNCLAFVNVLYFPFAIYKIINETDPKARKIWLTGLLISIAALILTLCKNVILTLLIQSGILFLFLPNKLKIQVFLSATGCFILVIAADFLLHLQFIDQFFNRVNNNASLVWRLKIWGYLLSSIDNSSLLAGHGVNAAKNLIGMINSRGSSYAHNAYLQLLFDYGLTGLFLMMAFIHPFIKFFILFLTSSGQDRLNKLFPMLIILAIFINMASDNSVFLRTPMVFAWLFLIYMYHMEVKPRKQLCTPMNSSTMRPEPLVEV